MKAILRLKQSGMTRSQIAAALGTTRHAVRFWELGLRYPNHDNREALLALAESKGILLLASDFQVSKDNNNDS